MNSEQLEKLKEWVEDNPEMIRDWLLDLNATFREVRINPAGVPAEEVEDIWNCIIKVWEMAEKVVAVVKKYE